MDLLQESALSRQRQLEFLNGDRCNSPWTGVLGYGHEGLALRVKWSQEGLARLAERNQQGST